MLKKTLLNVLQQNGTHVQVINYMFTKEKNCSVTINKESVLLLRIIIVFPGIILNK